MLPEEEGVTATSLGQRPSGGGKYIKPRSPKIIHCAPSAEGATAISLGATMIRKKALRFKNKKIVCKEHF